MRGVSQNSKVLGADSCELHFLNRSGCWWVGVGGVDQLVVEKVPKSQMADIDDRKHLLPSDISVTQLMHITRRRIQPPSEAIFFFVDQCCPRPGEEGDEMRSS